MASSGPHSVLPILEDFLFDITDGILTITASNLETSIIDSIEVAEEEKGSVAVPARILIDTLRALPEQPITFETDLEGKNRYDHYIRLW